MRDEPLPAQHRGRDSPSEACDALLGDGGKTYDLVLTNPPFGKKQSYRIVRDDDEITAEIVENLEAALDRFRSVALGLQESC